MLVNFRVQIVLVLFLLLSRSGAEEDIEQYKQLLKANMIEPNTCTQIKDGTFTRICKGLYPLELQMKYKDRHLAVATPYCLWRNEVTIVVAFYDSPLFQCKVLNFIKGDLFCQKTANSTEQTLIKPPAHMEVHCFTYQLDYLEQITKSCLEQSDRFRQVDPFNFSVFYYSEDFKRKNGAAAQPQADLNKLPLYLASMVVPLVLM